MATGKFPAGLDFLPDARAKAPRDLGPATEAGRRLAGVACAECHGSDLTGQKGAGRPPDLVIAGAYDSADFHRLMRTGVAAGGRQVGELLGLSQCDFSSLNG